MREDPRAITPRRPEPHPAPRTNKASNPTLATIAGLPELGQTLGPACSSIFVRTATKKQGGSSNNGRDSKPKFLGIKKYSGEYVIPGNIIAAARYEVALRRQLRDRRRSHRVLAHLRARALHGRQEPAQAG